MSEPLRQLSLFSPQTVPRPAWRWLSLATLILALLPVHRMGLAAVPTEAAYVWPLPLPERYLTSNFMEYRNGRFHTGLDLKTNSETGYAVLAAEDGWVVRLRTSAYGYGRAVYLQGESGRFFVYAHLERFSDQLRVMVRRAQEKNHDYDVDLYLQENRIPVTRGDVLGLSGQSGTAGPHLHFEVRNSGQQPLNPLHCGFSVPDTLVPMIRKVRAIPAAPGSRIAGSMTAHSVASRQGLSGQLPSLVVRGPVAFSAELRDASDIMGHRLTPQEVIVRCDGVLVHRTSNDSLAFQQNRQMRLEWLELPGVREKWLHLRPGNQLPGREGTPWSLLTSPLTPGNHQVEVVARDHAGNETRVSWTLEVMAIAAPWTALEEEGRRRSAADPAVSDNPRGSKNAAAKAGSLRWGEDPVRVPLSSTPAGKSRWLTPFLVVEQDTTTGAEIAHDAVSYPGLPGDHYLVVRSEEPRSDSPAAETLLWVEPDTLTAQEVEASREDQGLDYLGLALKVQGVDRHNWQLPVVELPAAAARPDSDLTVGVYRQGRNASWGHVETPLRAALTDSGLVWKIPVPAPGRLALFRDGVPPHIGPHQEDRQQVHEQEASQLAGVTLSRWDLVPIRVFDSGSGVDPTTLRGWLDGRPLVLEPDLIRQRILVELPDDLAPGEHEIILLAGDYAGNSSVRNLVLDCRISP